MGLRNTAASWGWPARLLHWAMAALVLGMLGFGLYLAEAFEPGDPAKFGLVQLHKSFGFTVFALACLRLGWRALNPVPALPAAMAEWERRLARAAHGALYLLMLAIPVTGWLMASASPYNDPGGYIYIRNMVFGLFELPDPIDPGSEDLEHLFRALHASAALALAAVLAVHVAGALKHALLDRDGVLSRMIRG